MSLEKRINAFIELGTFLKQFKNKVINDSVQNLNEKFYDDFDYLIKRQKAFNGWFTEVFVLESIDAIAEMLTKENLQEWVSNYEINDFTPKNVGVIMAGNIPLVGFHDFLSVLISGNNVIAKTSSEDNTLLKKIAEILIEIDAELATKIKFVERLENFEAVIATGSNNTARYFESYFGKYPNIIRKNRNSVAVISHNDEKENLNKLGNDIFQYYGLGCRNVSKLYVPKGYNFNQFFEAIFEDFQDIVNNNKYANNYDYNKAVYLLGNNQLLDNNFVLLKEDESFSSPVAVLHYEYYEDIEELKNHLQSQKENIQCIVSNEAPIESLKFGEAQQPKLWDYADGVDTMAFLTNL
ncbi:acyl-CoA reductase [Vicingus serpentipes]|uniref:long-chain-fatty-acyl-CoA reductase n=1 Tax=Vicingus serpentipes TaxID=1926625 RepID=A0A5C6RXM9_9FLAO|nr:acyl-CoA reductase [Vicingus serpentipes]TXB66923.1 acyl-CoA reductase [Vicingus serpentipes]